MASMLYLSNIARFIGDAERVNSGARYRLAYTCQAMYRTWMLGSAVTDIEISNIYRDVFGVIESAMPILGHY